MQVTVVERQVGIRILVITDYLPYPQASGDTIRVYNLIRRLGAVHELSLLALFAEQDAEDSINHLRGFCRRVEVINHEWPRPLAALPDMVQYLIQGKPPELRLLYSKRMAERIHELTSAEDFDIVQIEHSRLALYREAVNSSACSSSVLVFHNIAYNQYDRMVEIEKNPISRLRTWLFSRKLRRWEPSYAGKFDRCLTMSDMDRKILLGANRRLCIDVIPNGADTGKLLPVKAIPGVPALLFVGSMSYPPCADGAVYFCRQVLPYIKKAIPEIRVWIVGTDPLPDVLQLAGDGVHVTGYVKDVLPYYEQTAVSIVPLRAGGGTRLKILESMALGRPVVSTSIGCEGLDVIDGRHLLIADDPKSFADKTVRLLTDSVLFQHIATEARQLVVNRYDWDIIAHQLMDIYSELVQRAARPIQVI
jgi:glycosyltransferase involved in cell wall biosynthesis